MRVSGLLVALAIGTHTMPAQDAARFEAASIKANRSDETRIRYETPAGRVNAVNVPVRFFIRRAFDFPESRVIGGPGWLETDRFDIVGTMPADASTDQMRQMMQRLLAERFGLAVRRESREMPVYSLVRARPDGLGASLRPSTTACDPDQPRMEKGRVICGLLLSQGPANASLRGGATTIASVVRILAEFLERPLIDRTGLSGAYDLELQFTASRGAIPGGGVPGGLAAAASPDEIPSVFTAIQEQLGLRLVAERGTADVLVIDSISRPTED